MKKVLLLAFAAAILFAPVVAFADNLDTVTGTPITAEGSANTLNYTDAGGGAKAEVPSDTITTVVTSMYGFTGIFTPLPSAYQTTSQGVYKDFYYTVTNEGNASTTFNLTISALYQGGGATNWVASIRDAATGNSVISTLVVAEDETKQFRVRVAPGSLQTDCPNGAYGKVTVEVATTNTPVGTYLGANGITYGGTAESQFACIASIETAVMTLSRTATVDSPSNYLTHSGATAHDPVPGAVITYTIMVSNEGAAIANNVIIMDKVPNSTEAAHIGAYVGGNQGTLANVTITAPTPNAPMGGATGWKAYYTALTSPSTTYGATAGWTLVTVPISIEGTGATYVKFERQTVEASPTGATKTLTWGVTIR